MEIMDKGLTVLKLGTDSFVKNTSNILHLFGRSPPKRLHQAFVDIVTYYCRPKKDTGCHPATRINRKPYC